jgi:CubicO group peptidase (beta-lactamase class C family)
MDPVLQGVISIAAPGLTMMTPISDFIADIDNLAAASMDDWKVPGATLAVVQDGKLALLKAYGERDVEAKLPMTTSTQFLICSITKSFTATAIALLHNERRIDWLNPVRDYIPEFRLSDPVATDRVRILDLLSHQSGLPRHDWVHFAGDRTAAELLAPMRHLELSKDVRVAWQYNNLCYNVLGLLIERVTGQSYETFIRARLTDRLGMKVSFTLEELEASVEPATPYMMHEDTRLKAMRLPITTIAGGAINTTVADLANWMRLHLGNGEFEGERLLPTTLMTELHAPRVRNTTPGFEEFGEQYYALGLGSTSYRGDRILMHGGGWPGWGTLMTIVPDFNIGVAVFTNRSPSEVTQTLTWYIIDRLRGRAPVDWRERFRKRRDEMVAGMAAAEEARLKGRKAGTHPAHPLADYAARYEHPAYGVMSIEEQGGVLQWSWRGMHATLEHRHFETFELPAVPDRLLPDRLPLTFLTDRDGNVVSLSAPLEPTVKDIVLTRLAAGACMDPAFRKRCTGVFRHPPTTHRVTLDEVGNLFLKPDLQPTWTLAPHQGRTFRIVELEGFFLEFKGDGEGVDEIMFRQPNGTFVAQRVEE